MIWDLSRIGDEQVSPAGCCIVCNMWHTALFSNSWQLHMLRVISDRYA
jgi:hypothetical protein